LCERVLYVMGCVCVTNNKTRENKEGRAERRKRRKSNKPTRAGPIPF
jgi:hypothetical protein